MAIDYAFLAFLAPFVLLTITFLFRKRLLTALTGLILSNGVKMFDELLWEVVVVESAEGKVKQKVLTTWAKGFLGQAAPILISEGMKAIKMKIPQNLPINPQTGQLDFMAPILSKLASGKKIKIEDFLPLIMDKAMPMIEGMMGKLAAGTAAPKPGEAEGHPFLKEGKP